MASICFPICKELLTFPILKKKSVSTLNNNYSANVLTLLFDFHEITFTLLFRRLDDLKFYTMCSLVSESAFLRLILKSIRFIDSLQKKMHNSGLVGKIKDLSRKIDNLPSNDQLVLFLILTEMNKQKIEKIYVDLDKLFIILEKSMSSQSREPLLTSTALLYISSLMDDSNYISRCFEHKFSSPAPDRVKPGQGSKLEFYNRLFSVLRKFLRLSDFDPKRFLLAEVCSFGFANFGAYDGAIKILLANLIFSSKKKEIFFDFLKGFTYHGVKEVMFYLFEKMTCEFVLSLKGLVYLFSLIVELITNTKEHLLIIEALLKESRVKIILSFLNEDLFGASKTWPKKLGGHGVFDECLCNHVLKLLELLISGILRNNNKKYMKLLANQMKTFPNLMRSIMNVYLQTIGMTSLSENTSRTMNFKSAEYMKSKILPGRTKEVEIYPLNS